MKLSRWLKTVRVWIILRHCHQAPHAWILVWYIMASIAQLASNSLSSGWSKRGEFMICRNVFFPNSLRWNKVYVTLPDSPRSLRKVIIFRFPLRNSEPDIITPEFNLTIVTVWVLMSNEIIIFPRTTKVAVTLPVETGLVFVCKVNILHSRVETRFLFFCIIFAHLAATW